MIIISEVVDFRRFSNAKELMAYLGLTPSERSSGESERKGKITKCGNVRVRKALVESSWHYMKRPMINRSLKNNLDKVAAEARIQPVTALKRLYKRYYYLVHKGKAKL